MIRVCYLLRIADLAARNNFINDTIAGREWEKDGNRVTDRKMVSIASQYNRWAPEVYDFGNSFTHLTNFHDYKSNDPLDSVDEKQKREIRRYLSSYHGFPANLQINFLNIIAYLPQVATKVSDNLHSYLKDLEQERVFR